MEFSLSNIIDSKIFVKDGSNVTFDAPKSYIEPFVNVVNAAKPSSLFVNTQGAIVNENTDSTRNIAFPRVQVEARFSNIVEDTYQAVIGMIYALDLQKPIMKIYSGFNARACTNLSIFDAEKVFETSLMERYTPAFDMTKRFLDDKLKETEHFIETHQELINTFFTQEELNEELGRLLRLAPKVGLGSGPIVKAAELIDNSSSLYHVTKGESCSKMNLYQAITQSITNSKDVHLKPSKTVLVSRLLNIN